MATTTAQDEARAALRDLRTEILRDAARQGFSPEFSAGFEQWLQEANDDEVAERTKDLKRIALDYRRMPWAYGEP
jgi:hypothetical protein